jgi:hypothetical protein
LRFGAGDEVTAWSHLTLNKWHRGDIPGKITKVEEDPQGTKITVLFDLPGEEQFNSPQVFTISADRSTINGGSAPIIVTVDMKLFPKDAPSIVGAWAQPDHPRWFPNVNVTKFYPEGWTNYVQDGRVVMYSHDQNMMLKQNYKQDGSRITFFGVNPTQNEYMIIPYYGVLSADGKMLYVDAYDFTGARITSPWDISSANGPKGATPTLMRQK